MLVLALALSTLAATQQPAPAVQDSARPALKVFLDCQSGGCDFDYLRTEITFVDWVRDRTDADVHLLVTAQGTGSGGTAWTLAFLGLGSSAGRDQTLLLSTNQTDTADERRRALARVMRLGLVPYVSATPLGQRLDVVYDAGGVTQRRVQSRDPWKNWVFEVSASADLSGEARSSFRSFNGSIETRRVTEQLKVGFEFEGRERRSTFELDDSTTFTSRRSEWQFDGQAVWSLGPHWSIGGLFELERNSFRNYDLLLRVAPAIEFNVFPYSQSTRRVFTFQYAAGFEVAAYTDTTIFGHLNESHPLHNLEASIEARQPWGSTFLSASVLQYLHDLGRVNINLNASARIRLVRGLSLNFYGGYEVIRSQLYLPASGSTPEEVIAQQRALATNYSYYSGFGLRYTFGSIYNNVVNPRF